MQGTVYIYEEYDTSSQKLISVEDNMVMNNLGEILTDIFVIPNYLSQVSSVSALLDVSNYTIGAISFAPTPLGYIANARNLADPIVAIGASGVVTSQYTTVGYTSATDVSSPFVLNGFVSAVQPTHQTLLHDFKLLYNLNPSSPSQVLPGVKPPVLGGTSANYAMQQIAYDLGQHPNWIQYNSNIPYDKKFPPGGVTEPLPESSSIILRSASQAYGAFPHVSGTQYALFDGPTVTDIVVPTSILGPFPTYKGNFNSVSSMDYRGFVRAYTPNQQTNTLSGLIVSAASNFSAIGEVSCVITISATDLALVNFFGGIYQLGLWCLDPIATLANGVFPPFNWIGSNGVTEREFRLLCKKILQDNIAKIQDRASPLAAGVSNYTNLTLVWKLRLI